MADTSKEAIRAPFSRAEIEAATDAAIASLTSERDEARNRIAELNTDLCIATERAEKAEEDRDDLLRTFDLRWKADQRAIKEWRAKHPGYELVCPDHADLVVWLVERLDAIKNIGNTAMTASLALADQADADVATLRARVAALEGALRLFGASLHVKVRNAVLAMPEEDRRNGDLCDDVIARAFAAHDREVLSAPPAPAVSQAVAEARPAPLPFREADPEKWQFPEPSQAVIDVLAERRRQIEAEGWTPEHDDQHANHELAVAAACYAAPGAQCGLPVGQRPRNKILPFWPWSRDWWKPTDRRRDLVKAAALILAEIERLDRAAQADEPERTCPECGGDMSRWEDRDGSGWQCPDCELSEEDEREG